MSATALGGNKRRAQNRDRGRVLLITEDAGLRGCGAAGP